MRALKVPALLVVVLSASASAVAVDPGAMANLPEALRQAIAERDRIETARLDYTEMHMIRDEPQTGSASWQAAGLDYCYTYYGDVNVTTSRRAGGADAYTLYPWSLALIGSDVWERHGESSLVHVFPRAARPLTSLRYVGLDLTLAEDLDVFKRWEAAGLTTEFSEHREGELVRVEARHSDGYEMHWWIDPERGWSVVRTLARSPGGQGGEQVVTVEQRDGVWFPVRIERFSGADRNTPVYRFEVTRAEFNRREHPQRVTPTSIGVTPGTTIQGGSSGTPSGVWDGEKPIPPWEYFKRRGPGRLVWHGYGGAGR